MPVSRGLTFDTNGSQPPPSDEVTIARSESGGGSCERDLQRLDAIVERLLVTTTIPVRRLILMYAAAVDRRYAIHARSRPVTPMRRNPGGRRLRRPTRRIVRRARSPGSRAADDSDPHLTLRFVPWAPERKGDEVREHRVTGVQAAIVALAVLLDGWAAQMCAREFAVILDLAARLIEARRDRAERAARRCAA
jgi:hypothetical protein